MPRSTDPRARTSPPLRIVSTPEVQAAIRPLLGESLSWERWDRIAPILPDARRLLELPAFDAEGPARVWVFVPYGTIRPTDLPGPMVGRVLVSYVFYRSPAEVAHWWRALRQAALDVPDRALVLSMMKPFYLEWAERVRAALTARRFSGGRLRCHFPDETLHTELGEILSHGCTLAVYVGHGRSRGWSGYRGFRWKHVAPYPQQAPVGTMISLSCSSLAQDRERSLPMGLQWVMAGRCGAFLGACDAVEIQPLATITGFMLDILKADATLDAGDLVRAVDDQVTSSGCAEARRCWSSFRLIGNPFQPLQGAEVVASASKRSSTPVVACRQANSRARS